MIVCVSPSAIVVGELGETIVIPAVSSSCDTIFTVVVNELGYSVALPDGVNVTVTSTLSASIKSSTAVAVISCNTFQFVLLKITDWSNVNLLVGSLAVIVTGLVGSLVNTIVITDSPPFSVTDTGLALAVIPAVSSSLCV